ncbi:MAG: hypothetical protein ACMVP2_22910 [Imperialibacter sp.]|uniref:YxiG-like protein n=1 Tax=Imperialibacter sp. TaxID=2038411 RepID=UPI003A8C2AC2
MGIDKLKLEDIYDVAVLRHGFVDYVRDYQFEIETNWVGDLAGRYLLTFKHCYDLTYKTLVNDDLIKKSWDDIFTSYEAWEKNNKPEGFVWGTNWSLAYPGFESIEASKRAEEWSDRLDKKMNEVSFETDSFVMTLIYESWTIRKINNDNSLISQVIVPIKA